MLGSCSCLLILWFSSDSDSDSSSLSSSCIPLQNIFRVSWSLDASGLCQNLQENQNLGQMECSNACLLLPSWHFCCNWYFPNRWLFAAASRFSCKCSSGDLQDRRMWRWWVWWSLSSSSFLSSKPMTVTDEQERRDYDAPNCCTVPVCFHQMPRVNSTSCPSRSLLITDDTRPRGLIWWVFANVVTSGGIFFWSCLHTVTCLFCFLSTFFLSTFQN